jgi:hypothetical protein
MRLSTLSNLENIINKTNEIYHRSSRWFATIAIALSLLLVMHHSTWAADADPAAARFRGTGKADPIRIADIKKAAGRPGRAPSRLTLRGIIPGARHGRCPGRHTGARER